MQIDERKRTGTRHSPYACRVDDLHGLTCVSRKGSAQTLMSMYQFLQASFQGSCRKGTVEVVRLWHQIGCTSRL